LRVIRRVHPAPRVGPATSSAVAPAEVATSRLPFKDGVAGAAEPVPPALRPWAPLLPARLSSPDLEARSPFRLPANVCSFPRGVRGYLFTRTLYQNCKSHQGGVSVTRQKKRPNPKFDLA